MFVGQNVAVLGPDKESVGFVDGSASDAAPIGWIGPGRRGRRGGRTVAGVPLISAAVVIGGEFHLFVYVAYYPALAFFAVVSTSLWLGLAWTTMTAAVYAALSTAAGPGLDVGAGQEKALAARLAAMYAVVASVSLVARFERSCRLESARREQQLASERIELCTRRDRHGRDDAQQERRRRVPGDHRPATASSTTPARTNETAHARRSAAVGPGS